MIICVQIDSSPTNGAERVVRVLGLLTNLDPRTVWLKTAWVSLRIISCAHCLRFLWHEPLALSETAFHPRK